MSAPVVLVHALCSTYELKLCSKDQLKGIDSEKPNKLSTEKLLVVRKNGNRGDCDGDINHKWKCSKAARVINGSACSSN